MTASASDRSRRWERARRVAFFVWAAVLTTLVGVTFAAVTILTVGMWLAGQNSTTNPVTDLGFFALGGIIITMGLAAQIRAPEQRIAGVQQAAIGLLALGVAGLIGTRIEPLVGSLIFLVATAVLVALHPARGAFLRLGTRPSAPLTVLSILACIPATAYAATMLVQARQAGPSCFFGGCAYGDRLAEMAALALAIAVAGTLAAFRPRGWRLTAWSVGVSAAVVGSASIVLPEAPGSLGQLGGALALAWGVLFAVLSERRMDH